jgi:hypothetical protein
VNNVFSNPCIFYERIEIYSVDDARKMYRFNLVKRIDNETFAVLSCDPINMKDPTRFSQDQKAYAIDAIYYDLQDKPFHSSAAKAIKSWIDSWNLNFQEN